jgi:hypothetical protein
MPVLVEERLAKRAATQVMALVRLVAVPNPQVELVVLLVPTEAPVAVDLNTRVDLVLLLVMEAAVVAEAVITAAVQVPLFMRPVVVDQDTLIRRLLAEAF